jgi:hypothetical protein
MSHPYRSRQWTEPPIISGGCFVCRTRSGLQRVRLRTVLLGGAALAFLGINLACAVVAHTYARLVEKMVTTSAGPSNRTAATRLKPPDPPSPPPAACHRLGTFRPSPTEFVLDHRVMNEFLESQSELQRRASIVPESRNGKTIGIRIFGVGPESFLGTLGLQNGDLLETVNGFDMASPEKALDVYARLRTSDHLTVRVNRRGKEMNLDYHII